MATIQDELSFTKVQNGDDGVSISSVIEEYYISVSPNMQVGGVWSTEVPNNADPDKYIWRRLKTTLSDLTVTYTVPALIQGMTGIYPYIGLNPPENPREGQQWWKADVVGNITDFFVYKSGVWQPQTIQQSMLNIIALNAITITSSNIISTTVNASTVKGTTIEGGTVNGTTIEGSYIRNQVDARDPATGIGPVVNLSISNGRLYESRAIYTKGSTISEISEIELSAGLYDPYLDKETVGLLMQTVPVGLADPSNLLLLTPDGIRFLDSKTSSQASWKMFLSAEDTVKAPQTQLSAASGFSAYSTGSTNRPTAERTGRLVQLSGAFKNNAARTFNATEVTMGTLPEWAIPSADINFVVQGSGMNRFMLIIKTNGTIQIARYGTTGYAEAAAGSWLNIACTYTASDM